jgi:adenylate cyclase
MSFFRELKRRNVFRVGLAYLLAAWVLLQIVDFVLEVITAPDWTLQVFVLAAAVGLPVVLAFSWVFEMTSEGVKRESEIDRSQSITPTTGRKLDRVIIFFLAAAVITLLADRFLLQKEMGPDTFSASDDPTSLVAVDENVSGPISKNPNSIAVLPFVPLSSGTDDEYFADGLTEEILNSLSQLPELLVTARTSAFHFKGKDIPLAEIAATLGVANIVEGSVRRSGERLRVTAQLIRASDGFHLWSENYDSTSKDTIQVQEDIAEKIATAMDVVMDESKRERMRKAGLRDVEAFIAFQKGNELYEKAHGLLDQIVALREANQFFETVIQRVPSYSPAYQAHSDLYIHILLNDATQQVQPGVSQDEINAALDLAIADYQAAIKHASSDEERNNMELDLLHITPNWRGLTTRLNRFFSDRGCDQSSWVQDTALPFGYADQMALRAQEFRLCDPLSTSNWRGEARSRLWAGDAKGALEVAFQGSEIAPGPWLTDTLVRALISEGEFDQALAENSSRVTSNFDALFHQMLIESARGDSQAAASAHQQFNKEPLSGNFYNLMYHAWMGDLEAANLLAAEFDENRFGSMGLTIVIIWCSCGAPWDLAATPNFAQRLEEAGLSWPPVEVINFPLKKW